MPAPETCVTRSQDETEDLARRLAARLEAGATVLLYGDLGAGKTAFVRGLARGLDAHADEVSSPTFTLIQEYRGRLRLLHVDLYRLEPREVDDLGLDDLASGDTVMAVEWADRWMDPPAGALTVRIADEGDDVRRISIEPGSAVKP